MNQEIKQKILFLDRDGTICDDKGKFAKYDYSDYEKLIDNIELVDGVKESLKKIKKRGYKIIVISNQAGVAKGKMTESQVQKFNKKLNELLDFEIDGFYYCIHHDCGLEKNGQYFDENKIVKELIYDCDCRKPKIGMFLQAENDLKNGLIQVIDDELIKKNIIYEKSRNIKKEKIKNVIIDKEKSFMVGDKIDDTVAGKKYGIKSILVKTGEGLDGEKFLLKTKNKNEYTDYIVENINDAINLIIGE